MTSDSMSASWDITWPPSLSDDEIEGAVIKIINSAMRWEQWDEIEIWRLSAQFNLVLFKWDYSEKDRISNIDGIFRAFTKISNRIYNDILSRNNHWDIDNFITLINIFLKLLKVKYVYNTIPRQGFSDFHWNRDHTQILQLTLPRWEDVWDRRISHWGSCHNWSIVFKEYFDELDIPSSIILCHPFSNHSFTLFSIWWRFFASDPILKPWNEQIYEVKQGDKIFVWMTTLWEITSLGTDNWKCTISIEVWKTDRRGDYYVDEELKSYDSLDQFSRDLEKRDINYVIFWYRLNDNRWFKIDFSRESWREIEILIELWEGENKKTFRRRIQMKKFIWNFLSNFLAKDDYNPSLLEQILKLYISWKDPEKLEELQKELFSNEEREELIQWIGQSSNFGLFEAIFKANNKSQIFNSLFWGKNSELLEYFVKSTDVMHKRSVVKFLLFEAVLWKLDNIEHKKDTYARKWSNWGGSISRSNVLVTADQVAAIL